MPWSLSDPDTKLYEHNCGSRVYYNVIKNDGFVVKYNAQDSTQQEIKVYESPNYALLESEDDLVREGGQSKSGVPKYYGRLEDKCYGGVPYEGFVIARCEGLCAIHYVSLCNAVYGTNYTVINNVTIECIVAELLNIVAKLHERFVTHGDVAPRNIIVNVASCTSVAVTLIDFDCGKVFAEDDGEFKKAAAKDLNHVAQFIQCMCRRDLLDASYKDLALKLEEQQITLLQALEIANVLRNTNKKV